MTDLPDPHSLRPAPRDPANFLLLGVVISIVGAIIMAAGGDAAVIGLVVLAVGSVIGTIGVVGVGARMGIRSANYDEYLYRLIEQGDDEDTEV